MFIGHLALGFAAKRVTPQISLAGLFVAAQLADLLWPVFLAFGIEHVRIDPGNTAVTPLDFVSYPYSHSLLLLLVWGAALGQLYSRITDNGRVFFIISTLVISHWFLDFLTHRPDMPLYPGGPKFGVGLWNSVAGTLIVELAMYVVGLWVYMTTTRPRDRIGRWAFVGLAGFLGALYLVNLTAPPPPSVRALYLTALIGAGPLTLWSWWADHHRVCVGRTL